MPADVQHAEPRLRNERKIDLRECFHASKHRFAKAGDGLVAPACHVQYGPESAERGEYIHLRLSGIYLLEEVITVAKFAAKEPVVSRLARRPDAVVNYEGGLAFAHDPKHTLATMATCCLVNERAFYEDTTSAIDDLVRSVGRDDPEWLVKLAIYIRNELHLRSMPTRIAAIAATIPQCREHLVKGSGRILARPDDVLEFAAMLKDNRYGLSQRLPSVAKRVIAERLNSLDEFRAMKYRRGKGFGLKHLLKLSHPVPGDRRQKLIFSYLLDSSKWKEMTVEEMALIPKITAYETLKRLPAKHYQKARQLVRDNELPWEMVVPMLGSDRETWKTVAPVMPIMALVRNLRNLVKSGALRSRSVRDAVMDRLTDREVILNSRQLPFRWMSARNALRDLLSDPSCWPDASVAGRTDEALNQALEISSSCLPKWPGRTAIACDLSGSMSFEPVSRYSSVFPVDIACILAAVSHRLCDDSIIYAFGSEIAQLLLHPEYGTLKNAELIKKVDVGHATYGYKVIADLVDNRNVVDRIVVLTDMELYGESWYPKDSQDIRSWFDKYRRNVNKNVELYFVNLAAYGHFVTPQQEPGVTYISGWSEGILKYVAQTSSDFNMVDEVGRVTL